jgi:hypothetical protein
MLKMGPHTKTWITMSLLKASPILKTFRSKLTCYASPISMNLLTMRMHSNPHASTIQPSIPTHA